MDEVLAAPIAATSPMWAAETVLNVDGFGVFIDQAPARAPQASPVVHVLMHYPADFEHHLAGALTLFLGRFYLICVTA